MKTLAASLLATTSSLAATSSSAQDVNEQIDEREECRDDPAACEIVLAHFRVSADRLPFTKTGQFVERLEPTVTAPLRADMFLSEMPGIGLFRRANSLTAHPTTQGLSMRGVGANAAGRVLVTLDGVPLNDPFGGWIYWSSMPLDNIREVVVRRGGSSGAFGAQSLAGVVELRRYRTLSRDPGASVQYGDDNSYSLSGSVPLAWSDGGMQLSAARFETDGDFLLAESDRGPVDVRAGSDTTSVSLQISHAFQGVNVDLAASFFDEGRVNGLSLAVNETEALDVSLKLSGGGAAQWEVISYYRDRQFANVFASARDDRTTERAVLDQFDVPAWGAGLLARLQFDGLEFGVDSRRMSGETNERFRNLGAGFTRQRRAGGDQWTLGLYGEYAYEADWGALSATLRYDRWRTYGGERLEASIEEGPADFSNPLREDEIEDRSGGVWSGRIGAEVPLTGAVNLRTAAYKSWRLPTLNEFYRPFRVVNDITEANPNLTPETLYGIEIGFDYEPLNTVKGSVTFFRNWLHDGVGNVTIGFGPGFFELGGFVPAGGVLRQRANIDRSVTDGIEVHGALDLQSGWALTARYLYARARVTRFDARPELKGLRPVQTPRHSASLGAQYDGSDAWSASAELRYASSQFDDDLNTRRLDGIVTVNAGAEVGLSDTLSLTARIENLFDAKVVSAVTADGLETLAQRRFWRVGLSATF